jgi:nicotinamidase-related amidase
MLRDEPIGSNAIHVCVDMQRMYQEATPWALPWMPKVLPNIVRLCERHKSDTIFTRFIPARRPGEGVGTWRRYYRRWEMMTIEHIGFDMVDLAPELRRFVPPGQVVDKPVYSPWLGSSLRVALQARGIDTILVTGGETDMCVLSTVLGAVDFGYRTIVVRDALCSASDESHDAMIDLFSNRYGQHIETADTAEILRIWDRYKND